MQTDNRPNIKLGDKAKDTISGLTGIVVAVTDWLNGCRRITIQPEGLKDGKRFDNDTFDIEQMELIKAAPPKVVSPSGGPSISPTRSNDPTR